MAVTEQQFINAYSQMDADKQQKAYNAGNAQVRSWIDSYNASQNNNEYSEGNYDEGPANYIDQGYYSSGAYNDVGGVNVGDWNYGEDTGRRQQEIVNNLNQAYQQDPSRFSDWNTFAKNFNYSYSGRSEKERQTMQNWYNQNVGNVPSGVGTTNGNIYGYDPNDVNGVDYFFNQLMAGENLGGDGASINAARDRYNNWKVLSGMTPNQIVSAIDSSTINPVGQEMQDLKQYSPELYAQVQAARQGQTELNDINMIGDSIYSGLTGTETNGYYTNYDMSTGEFTQNASIIKQYNESLYKKIEALGGDTSAYVAIVASMLQNPAIQGSKNEVEDLEGEIRKIQEQIYTIGDTARATLGSEAPEDLVSAYISHQTKQLQNQLRTAQNSLLVAQGKLNNQLSEVDTMIDAINYGLKTYGTGEETTYVTESSQSGRGGSYGGGYTYTPAQATYDYQDDSPERLTQIRDNLANYAKTNPELFKDRATFNDYFKFNQRSDKQKAILNAAWAKYGNTFGIGSVGLGGGSGTTTSTEDDKWRKLMQGIIAGDVGGGYGKTAMKTYGFERELNEQEVMANIALICSPSEYSSLLKRLGTGAKKELNTAIDERIDDTIDANAAKIQTRLKSVKKKNRAEEANKLAKELGINFGTKGEEHIMNYYNSL